MRPILLLVATGCGPGTDETGTPLPLTTTSTTTTPTSACPAVQAEVITVTTDDGVPLEADRYAGDSGAPGIVLLHMIPPSNTRADWPVAFIDRLTCQGWSVLALDRRGSGNSGGAPQDSYVGPAGALDVEAAVAALTEVGASGIAVLGASNGTTSALDYAVAAPDEGWPEVVALGFLTGGDYTEQQNLMEHMPKVPAVFTYSTAENAWSEDQRPLNPGSWSFLEYSSGDHGTLMFDAAPEVGADLEAFLVSALSDS